MHTADWQQLHSLSEQWLSELAFYHDELLFLKDVINKYFIWLVADEKMELLTSLSKRLIKMEQINGQLLNSVKKNMGQLTELMANTFSHDEQIFRHEHSGLEDDIANFIGNFASLKKEIFAVTKRVIETERLKRLLAT